MSFGMETVFKLEQSSNHSSPTESDYLGDVDWFQAHELAECAVANGHNPLQQNDRCEFVQKLSTWSMLSLCSFDSSRNVNSWRGSWPPRKYARLGCPVHLPPNCAWSGYGSLQNPCFVLLIAHWGEEWGSSSLFLVTSSPCDLTVLITLHLWQCPSFVRGSLPLELKSLRVNPKWLNQFLFFLLHLPPTWWIRAKLAASVCNSKKSLEHLKWISAFRLT